MKQTTSIIEALKNITVNSVPLPVLYGESARVRGERTRVRGRK